MQNNEQNPKSEGHREIDNQESTRIEKSINSEPLTEGYQPNKPLNTNNPPQGNPSESTDSDDSKS